jgi:beta-glucanase (GH16 family)
MFAAAGISCHDMDRAPTNPSPGLTWSDEFEGSANSRPDATKWTYDLGHNNGWGNQELQTYTDHLDNVHLDGKGHLIIRADRAGTGYTSARLKTQGLFAARYGRIEARIRVPAGRGLWPAFWMLGTGFPGTPWPQSGEIDIMEHVGRDPMVAHGTVHGPGYSGGAGLSGKYILPGSARFADDFHVFAIDWRPGSITFQVDGTSYHTVTPASLPAGAPWVFDAPFFLLLNVAVGGLFPGPPDETTVFPQEMMVDYVRVFAALGQPRPSLGLRAPRLTD